MKLRPVTTFTVACLVMLLAAPGALLAQDEGETIETKKLAQTGFKFLSTSLDARGAAMADALTSDASVGAAALLYNPSTMAFMDGYLNVLGGQTMWIGDINYNMASLAFRPLEGAYGVFGLSIVAVDYGTVLGTVRADNEQGYSEYADLGLSDPSPTSLAIGVGYAKMLSDRFAVGGQVKYAKQDLGDAVISGGDFTMDSYSQSTVAFDFGVLYKTGFRSLNFAMSARNFSRELKYVQENFELPLSFRVGVAMDLMDLTSMDSNMHAFLLAIDAERPRDFSEQLKFGGEYRFMNILALRAGYTFPTDEQGVNLGAGLNLGIGEVGFRFDYAYTTFSTFDNVNRWAVQFYF